MLRPFLVPLLALFALSFVLGSGCGDDSVAPEDESFSLGVVVREADGTPVSGLQVVVWNMSSSLEAALQDEVFRRRAVTVVRMQLPQRAVCDFAITDVEGAWVTSLLEADTLAAGLHALRVGADVAYRAGVETFRYELIARDVDTGEELFRDAKWMTAVHLDPGRLAASTTDARGRWSTASRTFVPGLLDVPTMPIVDVDGTERGSFALGDTVVVRVYAPTGGHLQQTAVVGDGANTLEFTWDVDALRAPAREGEDAPPVETSLDGVPGVPLVFRLEQNAPNPFN